MPIKYVSREQWEALPPRRIVEVQSSDMEGVVVHHTVSPSTGNLYERVRGFDHFHRNTKGWFSIAYNHLIGMDGTVFEGRGSGVQQGATHPVNSRFYSVAFIGNFQEEELTNQAVDSFRCLRKMLLLEGVGEEIRVHREFSETACPGKNVVTPLVIERLSLPAPEAEVLDLNLKAMRADWEKVKKAAGGRRKKKLIRIADRNLARF